MWKSKDGAAIGARVRWNQICRHKKEGGLGLKSLIEWNTACLSRIVWMLFSEKNTLWIAWMRINVLKMRRFWEIRSNTNSSWW